MSKRIGWIRITTPYGIKHIVITGMINSGFLVAFVAHINSSALPFPHIVYSRVYR